MSAAVVIEQKSGTDYENVTVAKSEFYYISVDNCLADYADYKVQILSSGTNYSYEVWLRFRCDVAPGASCSNFKIWTIGSLASGLGITVNSDAVTTYDTPSSSLSTQGTRASILTYTALNKLSIGGTLVNIGDKSNFMVFQLSVADTADLSSGGSDELDILYQYDES